MITSIIGLSVGWTTAMTTGLLAALVVFPMHLAGKPTIVDLSHLALDVALKSAALPLLILSIIALRFPPSPRMASLGVALSSVIIRSPRVHKAWSDFSQLPDWMPADELLVLLPTSLAAGLAFGLACKWVSSNGSFKSPTKDA
ncbi:MAG TPA: hypothetical protein VGE64_12555 [Xanthomonadaceae bacterium]